MRRGKTLTSGDLDGRRWRTPVRVLRCCGILVVATLLVLRASRALAEPEPASRTDALAWEIVEVEPITSIWATLPTHTRIVVKNVGSSRWSDEQKDALSYHWLDRNDRMLEFEGARTSLPRAVNPGESIELSAIVIGPVVAGDFRLEWEMVRERVAWYGPPIRGGPHRIDVSSRWQSAYVQLLLAALALVGAIAARRFLPRAGRRLRIALELLPALFCCVALYAIVLTFGELVGVPSSGRGSRLAASGSALVVLPMLLANRRILPWILAALISMVSLLAVADRAYMGFYGTIVPLAATSAAHQLAEVRSSVLSLIGRRDAWFLPIPLASWAVAALWPARRPDPRERKLDRLTRGGLAVLLALGALPAGLDLWRALKDRSGKFVVWEERNVKRTGFLNAHLLDVARKLRYSRSDAPTEQERATIYDYFAKRQASAPKRGDEHFGAASGKNLILIQVEAAQTWVVDLDVAGRPITPYLRGLREKGLYYPNIADQTWQGMTSDAEYATLNSQHPLHESAVCFSRASNDFVTIAHVLADHGYTTLSAHPFARGFWNRALLHPRYGFQRSLFRDEIGAGPNVGWGLADRVFFERMLPELSKLKSPFFAFLITLSLHHPYDHFPDPLKQLDLSSVKSEALANYLHGMNYFDRSLESFVDALGRSGLAERTVVAIYGDHDARFGLDPEMLALAGYPRSSFGVFHAMDRIPFFVLLPGTELEGSIGQVGGHVDIAPTLLFYLGVDRPASFLGRALDTERGPGWAARPGGSAHSTSRMFVIGNARFPAGTCFVLPELSKANLDECRELREGAATELAVSHGVVNFNLHRALYALK